MQVNLPIDSDFPVSWEEVLGNCDQVMVAGTNVTYAINGGKLYKIYDDSGGDDGGGDEILR